MTSIGNDIITLALTNPERTRREKFFSKIICRQEVELFNNELSSKISFENFVWLAWSVKESVYKFCSRSNPTLVFSPTKITISKIQLPDRERTFITDTFESISFDKGISYCCKIDFEGNNYFSRSLITNDLIFSVCNDSDDFDNVCWGIKKIANSDYEDQSASVRFFTLNKLKNIFNNADLSIEKKPSGYPVISQKQNIPLSFTHHGRFVGYAFALHSNKIKIPHNISIMRDDQLL